jgi:uncharacterized protein YfaS (alpha-2-macroglobulin family)
MAMMSLVLMAASALADEGPRVVEFSPQGTVKGVRQARAQFSDQMVPIGDPGKLIDPFAVTCPQKGTARWADSKNWVFDFTQDLPAGIRCEFSLKPGLKTLDGRPLSARADYAFSTGGPSVTSTDPYQDSSAVDEDQVFMLTLDAPVNPDSVLVHVAFSVEGVSEPVGVRIITGRSRTDLLKARFRQKPASPIILLQAKQRFPNAAKVRLIWGKGVTSTSGVGSEQDQVFQFNTRKPFRAELRCERENAKADCLPITSLILQFTGPVSWEQAKRVVLKGPEGSSWKPVSEEEEVPQDVTTVSFKPPFPEQAAFTIEIPPGLKDDAGRTLTNADKFPLALRTHTYPPLAKFSGPFGIIESKAEPALPVTLRNVEPEVKARVLKMDREALRKSKAPTLTGTVSGKIARVPVRKGQDVLYWLDLVTRRHEEWATPGHRETSIFGAGKKAMKTKAFTVPKPGGGHSFEVVGIPLPDPGFYVIELESRLLGKALLGKPKPMFVSALALVTNLSVHFKWGRESSLAWVTTLDQGRPVSGASVTVKDCSGKALWQGQSDANGVARIESLPEARAVADCAGAYPYHGGLLITAELGEDLTFVHSSWDKGIEPWRFQLPEPSYRGPVLTHSIMDRSLLRAGETVHMKHVLRRPTMQGFGLVPVPQRPTMVAIQHQGSSQTYEIPVTWDGQGIAETTWTIPAEAKLGVYEVMLRKQPVKTKTPPSGESTAPQDGEGDSPSFVEEWTSGRFRVEEFRVPLMKGAIQPPREPLVASSQATLDLSVQYLAGGGANGLPVTLRSQVQPRTWTPLEGFEDFTFANGPVKVGMVRQGGDAVEEFSDPDQDANGTASAPASTAPKTLQIQELKLDSTGGMRTTVMNLPMVTMPMDLHSELEFRDPNGETQTISRRIPLWPAQRLVGIKPDSWAVSKESLKFHVAVVTLAGKPVSEAQVTVDLFQRKTYSHRTRLIGGFYAYEHVQDTKRVGVICEGRTTAGGLLLCEAKSPVSGNVVLQAVTKDEEGREVAVHQDVWIAGQEEWWFDVTEHDRMDLLPGRPRYEPGETAIFQVRMPFREATALVAVEREGVIDTMVTTLSGKASVVEVPIKGPYAPNVFVSVLAVRGRVGAVQPTAMVDLARPAYKLGIAEIKVGWKAHELNVSVSADRPVYKVREKARVRIAVTTVDGTAPPAGSEVTVAAVDEGLLELLPNPSWKLLDAMMGRRGYEVRTMTGQMQVVGKRHFGLKAQPPGGGGGRQSTRELFDTLLMWQGRVQLDQAGTASLEIPLNDSITAFRIVAVATGGNAGAHGQGLFGTGATSIRSSQDLMLFSGAAPLVRESDRIRSEFTLRNATDHSMSSTVTARIKELSGPLASRSVSLDPGESKVVGWDLTVPLGADRLTYLIEASDSAGHQDSLTIKQRVIPVVPVQTIQATMAQVEREWRLPVERPSEAVPGRGGISLRLRPSLTDGLSGVVEYMSRYPYRCLEQDVSRAVALRDRQRWTKVMAGLPSLLDGDGLAKYFASMDRGSDVLTSYLLAIGHEAGWDIPQEPKARMEAALKGFIAGTMSGASSLPAADLSIRKLAAIDALSRTGQATPDMLASIAIEPNLWPTSAVLDWFNILQRLDGVPDRAAHLKSAGQILRSRLNLQGATMGFSTESSDRLWWLMVSSDLNAVKLIASVMGSPEWKEDLPRLMRGALARQRRGAWDLTLANAWGMLAAEKFAKTFEGGHISGQTSVTLAGREQEVDWAKTPQGDQRRFDWPGQQSDLILRHTGSGKPWVIVHSQAAVPRKEPFSSGYTIRKTIMPVKQQQPGVWSQGDLMRVRLDVEAQADMTWVVLSDPIPGGGSIVGSGLGRDSQLATQGEQADDALRRLKPVFEERSFEAFRAYYEMVPKGRFSIEYTVRLNQSGRYQLPATRAEAMYAPEMFGERPNEAIEVR